MMIWVDVETTGLEPTTGCLLEVAVLATDDDLRPLDAGISMLVSPSIVETVAHIEKKMDPVVVEMHQKSGLLDALRGLALAGCLQRRYQVAEVLARYVQHHTALAGGKKPPMCGSSVHFDRAWLKEHMPELEKLFSYRNIDVSTLKELAERWSPGAWEARPKGAPAHRAMSDIGASIFELEHYRKYFLLENPDGLAVALEAAAK